MSNTSKIILITIIATCILLGLGYAAIQNITLNISGTAVANAEQSSFKVKFTGTPVVSNNEYVTAAITDDINATIAVSGLTERGQSVTATYDIINESSDLSADLAIATTNSNTEYFTIKSQLADKSIEAKETTTVTVTIELTKTPIANAVESTIGVQMTAIPVQPGEEGSSGITNDYSETPVELTNDRIGDYIDLGNNIIGTEATTDDWRILYKDDTTIYAILADYLPSEQVPPSLGLKSDPTSTEYPESVWSEISADDLINALNNENAWSDFTNGINGAKVVGAPSRELFNNSYYVRSGENVFAETVIDKNIKDYDLYVLYPKQQLVDTVKGYWLTTKYEDGYVAVRAIYYNQSLDQGGSSYYYCDDNRFSARPVVSLPITTNIELVNGVWTVIK